MGAKGRDREFARMQQTWEPLWKNKHPRMVSKEEETAIIALGILIHAPYGAIETIIDLQGNKGLRIKKKIGEECNIDLFDYYLSSPVLFNPRGIMFVQRYGDDKRILRDDLFANH